MKPEEEFEAFVLARSDRLRRLARMLTNGDAAAADDVVQDTIERLWRSWDRICVMENADGYVRKILMSQFLRGHRRTRWFIPTAAPPDTPLPDHATASADRSDMRSHLLLLPPAQRAVIVLRFWDDRTIAQTAEALGISVGTVKSHSVRGLATLRRRLDGNRPVEGDK